MPDSAAVVTKNSLTTLGTNQQIERLVYDLAFCLEARELARFSDQVIVNFDICSAHEKYYTPLSANMVYGIAGEKTKETGQAPSLREG
ncbi:MAG: hypothetical protein WBV46_00465 [Terriglobales bacterium]